MSGTKVHSNYEDLLTFTRASKGHALRPVSYGTELVTNGTFDSDLSDWYAASNGSRGNITWTNETVVVDNSISNYNGAVQSITTEVGKIYKFEAEFVAFTGTSNNCALAVTNIATGTGAYASNSSLSIGVNQVIFVAQQTTTYIVVTAGTSTDATYDNVSVKEVTFDQPDGTLTLFEHPENVPRVEYDADGNRLGLLVEEQRVNLILNSSDFSVGSWTKSGSSISAATNITAPDGTTNSFKLIESSSTAVHRVEGASAAGGTTSTMSCFMKKAERKWGNINFSGLGGGNVWFDLENGVLGTVGASVTARIEDYGNGWYRCSVTGTPTSSAPTDIKVANADNTTSYTGDGTSGIYIFGAQTEAGSFPTSYIKTTGSTATRSADVASIPVADFGYNQSAGTLFVEANAPDGSNQNRLTQLVTSGGATNRVVDLHRVTDDIVMYNGTTTMTGDAFAASHDIKAAGAYKSGDYALVSDGGSATTVSDSTVYTPDTLTIGMNGASARQLNGHIKKLMYIPRRVTNAQLISLTE